MNNSFNEMMQVSTKNHSKIKKTCEPLMDHFGVTNFTILKITNSGNFYGLFSHPAWMEHYFGEEHYLKQPHFRHPRHLRSGICPSEDIDDENYQDLIKIASKKFDVNFTLGLLNAVSDGIELFGFDTKTPAKVSLFLNELPLLQKFISHFRAKHFPLLHELEETAVDMLPILGETFDQVSVSVTETLARRDSFLEKIGIKRYDFSVREIQILTHMLDGYSASQIAAKVYLSPRTIEHSVERIKDKMSCFSKFEVIQKARELESLGYL